MNRKIILRIVEAIFLLTSLVTSILTLTLDMNFKGIPALSLSALTGLLCYEEAKRENTNQFFYLLFFAAFVLNLLSGISLFIR